MTGNIQHVIWDWNGTLLDDVDITVGATIDWLESLGRTGVTREMVREVSSRDFAKSFSTLLGRPVTDAELEASKQHYFDVYEPAKRTLPLAVDALNSLNSVKERGKSQSLLSMAPHGELTELVGIHGLDGYFSAVDGYKGGSHSKLENLKKHLDFLALDPKKVALIGDAIDDFEVSKATGIQPILVTTGMYAAQRLVDTGARVEDTLLAAVVAALR